MRPPSADQIKQVLRFGLVGGLSTLTFLGVHALMVGPLRTGEAMGTFVAFAVSIGLSYLGQSLFTFRVPPSRGELIRFIIASVALACLGAVAADHAVSDLGLPSNLAALVIAAIYPVLSFILQKFWVFRRKDVGET